MSCLTISSGLKPWVDCHNYLKTAGQWRDVWIHTEKDCPFVAGVLVPMFSNSCRYIITYILLNMCLFSIQYIWLFHDTIFISFCSEFYLTGNRQDKEIPSNLSKNNKLSNLFLARACITVYQLIQDQCSHSDTPLEKRAQKESISVKWINFSKL